MVPIDRQEESKVLASYGPGAIPNKQSHKASSPAAKAKWCLIRETLHEYSPKVCRLKQDYLAERITLRLTPNEKPRHYYPKDPLKIVVDPVTNTIKEWTLSTYFEIWRTQSSKRISFQDYMEKEVLPKLQDSDFIRPKEVVYLKRDVLANMVVTFNQGKPKIAGHYLKDGAYLFVLDKDDNFFIMMKGSKRKWKIGHTSFSHGKPVKCAGMVKIIDEVIREVKLHSGHYAPKPRAGLPLLAFLQRHMPLQFMTFEERKGDKWVKWNALDWQRYMKQTTVLKAS